MRLALLATIVLALAAAPSTAVARGGGPPPQSLQIVRTTLHPDQREVVMTVRCRASKARCAGILRVAISDVDPLTAPMRVRLAPGHARQLSLRLRADGLHRMAENGPKPSGTVTLSARGRRLSGSFALRASPTCRTGPTLATSPQVRVFRLLGFGVYGCLRPAGRPVRVAVEDDEFLFPTVVDVVATAGRYVALEIGYSAKCTFNEIVLFDVRARRVARRSFTGNTFDSGANTCAGTTPAVALLVRPSGAMAWSEAAGDDGAVTIRSVDAAGHEQLLDHAADVNARSLRALDADRIGWKRAGALRTAALR
ncbi:MAG TPA: hypothetical protein VGM33_16380 [Baekduia sp.]|jgi:hypothetical protein